MTTPLDPVPPDKHPARIAGMFDAIAGRYDLLNRILSAGLDRRWRRRAIVSLHLTGRERILDVCTGTADLAIAACTASPGAAEAIGVDFAGEMLRIGGDKIRAAGLTRSIRLVRGDAMRLPLADGSVDAIASAFGIRNVEHPGAACREMHRVLRPRGRLALLEFAIPRLPVVRTLYLFYFRRILPRIGRAISGDRTAYSYLPRSVDAFGAPGDLVALLRREGFDAVSAVPLTAGILYLYSATRPDVSARERAPL